MAHVGPGQGPSLWIGGPNKKHVLVPRPLDSRGDPTGISNQQAVHLLKGRSQPIFKNLPAFHNPPTAPRRLMGCFSIGPVEPARLLEIGNLQTGAYFLKPVVSLYRCCTDARLLSREPKVCHERILTDSLRHQLVARCPSPSL